MQKLLIAAIIIMLANLPLAFAIQDPYPIYGYAKYANGEPIVASNITVSVPNQTKTATSDSAGKYVVTLDSYANGDTITASITAGIYSSTSSGTVNTSIGGSMINLTIDRPPVLNAVGNKTINQGQTLTIDLDANDPDGQAIVYAKNVTYGTINATTGLFSWTPGFEERGNYYINFTATANGLTAFEVVQIVVRDITPPYSISNLAANTGNFWINWSWTKPGNSDFSHAMVYINGSWQANVTASYYNATYSPHAARTISIRAVDTSGNINSTWVNLIAAIPNNPVSILNASDAMAIDENRTIFIDLDAADADGDIPAFYCSRTDLFKDFSQTTGKGNFTPLYNQSGTYTTVLGVSDGYGSTSNKTLIISVNDIPLAITSIWNSKTGAAQTLALKSGGIASFGITTNRSANAKWYYDGMLEQDSAVMNFSRQFTQAGTHYVIVSAYDAYDITGNITFTVLVQGAPSIVSWGNSKTNSNALTVDVNVSEYVNFNATSDQPVTAWHWYVDGKLQSWNYDNITLSWNSSGAKVVLVNATNANGTSSTVTWNITAVQPFTYNLYKGWNLISLPVIANYTAASLASAIGDKARHIIARNLTTAEYQSYTTNFSGQENNFPIIPDYGYYVYLDNATAFTIYGSTPGQRTISLSQGWNLIGYTSLATSNATAAFVEPLAGNAKYVTMRNETTGSYHTYIAGFSGEEDNFAIEPGHGYFIYASIDCTLSYG